MAILTTVKLVKDKRPSLRVITHNKSEFNKIGGCLRGTT